jgi:hypothetical protein
MGGSPNISTASRRLFATEVAEAAVATETRRVYGVPFDSSGGDINPTYVVEAAG